MKEIIKTVYHVGDSGCSVFLVDTQSDDGLVLIDCGMSLSLIKKEEGHDHKTAALWYGVSYTPVKLEKRLKGDIEILKFGQYEFQCIHTPGHTPGSIVVLIEVNTTKVLFGQDLHGPIIAGVSNVKDYQNSLRKVLDLKADILCEGHFGIFQPAEKVERYIRGYME